MEFLDGETLADRLRRSPMRLQDFLHCAIQVAERLSHAHRHGLIHRDLKPANIMLTSQVQGARLWAGAHSPGFRSRTNQTRTETLTHEGTVIGTYPYMSPEQLQGGEVDARSDIFAFGAVLHEMITGSGLCSRGRGEHDRRCARPRSAAGLELAIGCPCITRLGCSDVSSEKPGRPLADST